jgi:hypothetical protein
MPKTIPQNGQANWGTALNSHIGQLNDPTYGGFNIVQDNANRDAKYTGLTAENAGLTVYNKASGGFQVLEFGTSTGLRWVDLGREVGKNKRFGSGTLTYGINNGANPAASDFYTYLESNTGDLDKYVKEGDTIAVTDDFMYLVGAKVSASRFKASVSKDTRNNSVNAGVTFSVTAGSREFTISQADYLRVGDSTNIPGDGFGLFIVEKVNSTTYRNHAVSPIPGSYTIATLRRPMTNFNTWEILETTLNVDGLLTVYPSQTVSIKDLSTTSKSNLASGQNIYTSRRSSIGGNHSDMAAPTGKSSYFQSSDIWASRGVGLNVDSTLSDNSSDWKGYISDLAAVGVSTSHHNNLSIDSVTERMFGFSTGANINSGKVNHVLGLYFGTTRMHAANATNTEIPDTLWGIYQVNHAEGVKGYKMAKNMFGGNVHIKEVSHDHNYAANYAEADQRLVVNGNIRATGTVTQNSDITLKKDIKEIDSAVSKLSQIKGVTYKWKNPENHGDDETEQLGVIAQDVEKVFPQAVSTDTNGIKSVSYGDMVAPLIQAIKELKAEIEELKKKV